MQTKMVGGFDADNNLTALHIRLSGQSILAGLLPQNLDKGDVNPQEQGHGYPHVPGPHAAGPGARVQLHDSEPSHRPLHAQPARSAVGLLRAASTSTRTPSSPGMLHGRTGAIGRPGRTRIPAQVNDRIARATSRSWSSMRWPRRSAGTNQRRKASIAGVCADDGL